MPLPLVAIYRVWQAGPVNKTSLSKQPTAPEPSPEVRVSDADRDRVAQLLREALAEGRLTVEEHAERVESAYAAKTAGQLEQLLIDLPAGHRSSAPVRLAPSPATSTNLVAVFGAATRKGRWRAGRKVTALACFGGVDIDLTEALYEHRQLDLRVTAVFGGVDIRVPENVTLRSAGNGVLGGFDVEVRESTDPDAPVIVVHGLAVFGGVEARVKKGRRVRDLRAHRD